MQSSRFPSREQLTGMPISLLRNLDVQTQDEEALLQEVLNEKIKSSVIIEEIKTDDVPDISTPEDEAKWQEILDQRRKAARVRMGIVEDVPVDELEKKEEEVAKIDEQIEALKGQIEEKPAFCSYCASRGVRHLKTCTRPLIKEDEL